MKNKETIKTAQPWELELAEVMCALNLEAEKEKFDLGNNQTPFIPGFEEMREGLLAKAISIIREVKIDSAGEPILTPEQWLDKTEKMNALQKQQFMLPHTDAVYNARFGKGYDVPASLTGNFAKLYEMGIRHAVAVSGRLADQPNQRDQRGFPYALCALARPVASLTFQTRYKAGSHWAISPSQADDISAAARETGWVLSKFLKKDYMILQLPVTPTGKSSDQILDEVNAILRKQDSEWRERDDWNKLLYREFSKAVVREGGRILYTDRDIADKWDSLTEAIVRKTKQRWEREYPRISDIQVNSRVNHDIQIVEYTIRCRIDGDMQMSKPLQRLDGGRYNISVYNGDQQQLNELKRELAATYFSEELRTDRNQNQGLKR